MCVLLHNLILHEEVNLIPDTLECDVICMDILKGYGGKHRFILVYRPPHCTVSHDDHLLSILIDLVTAQSLKATILGDLNLSIDWSTKTAVSATDKKFLHAFDAISMVQFVNFSTRNDRTLDVIFSCADSVTNVRPLPPLGSADHKIILFSCVDCLRTPECQ